MADKKTETKIEKTEREYVIPIRRYLTFVPKYKRANKAIKIIKDFLVQHMKVYDKDHDKIKLDKYINELVWNRGIKKPPVRIKVKAIKEGEIVKVELVDMPSAFKFKKAREDRLESSSKEKKKKSKTDVKEELKDSGESTETEEKKIEEKEKKASVVEAGHQLEKEAAKHTKHQTHEKVKQPRQQFRKALDK